MRKIKNLLFVIAMILCTIPVIQKNTVNIEAKTSYTYYQMNCSENKAYEVDTINDKGGFDSQGCYVDFNSAKVAMNEIGIDAVVRHVGSFSANQIIAMTNGYVFTYGDRESASTVNINGYGGTTNASTYIQNYRGLYYEDTLNYNGSGAGSVLVNAFGFEGTVSMKMVDFIPLKFFAKDLPIWVGGNDTSNNQKNPWQVVPNCNYYSVVRNGNYLDLVLHGYNDYPENGINGNHSESYTGNLAVGPAASWMNEGDIYFSFNDTDFYSDPTMQNKVGTYYNYYLFEPLRTKSYISADKYNAFLENQGYGTSSKLWNTGSIFLEDQEKYGINAASVFAQACVEAAYGTSYYATKYNNLFGVGAFDDGPNVDGFETVNRSINNQMGILLRYYTDTDCRWYYGGTLGNKGGGITTKYASSATYGLTLASLYYRFDKFASGNDGTLTDWESSVIGVLYDTVTNVYTNTTDEDVLYQYRYGYDTDYVKNQTVVILGQEGDYYQIQSTDYIVNGAEMHPTDGKYADYDWNTMVGYVKCSDVKVILNEKNTTITPVSSINEMYRLYNPNSGEHFYTKEVREKDSLISTGWMYEGVGWKAPASSNTPVYRLYNPNAGEHHYTTSSTERDSLVKAGWKDEGIGWYSDDNKSVPLYRQYNPNQFACNHNYTTNANEMEQLIRAGWRDEGVSWYGVQ